MITDFLHPETYQYMQPWIAAAILGALTLLFEDVALLIGVALVSSMALPAWPLAAGLTAGILIGDMMLYGTGRWFQRLQFVQKRLSDTQNIRTRKGLWSMVILCRAIPASRLPTLVAAGLFKLNMPVFAAVIAVSVCLWVGIILFGGASLLSVFQDLTGFSSSWLVLPLIIAIVLYTSLKPMWKRQSSICQTE